MHHPSKPSPRFHSTSSHWVLLGSRPRNSPENAYTRYPQRARQFGKAGILYYEFARGIDNRPVEAVRIRKSVGCEHTLEKDISRKSSVIIELYHVATELIGRLERSGFKGNTLTLKVKFHDFNQITRSLSRPEELTTLDKILPLAKELLKEVEYTEHPIRLIGLSVSNPVKEEPHTKDRWEQLSFEFSDWK